MKCEKCQKEYLGECCWDCTNEEIEKEFLETPRWDGSVEAAAFAKRYGLDTPQMTLPLDSQERKKVPLLRGCYNYFPAALAGVAKISQAGNDKHNPGQDLHHARAKSSDHGDCILRHLMDSQDLLAALDRGEPVAAEKILEEISQLAWRTLAYSQELHEKLQGAPLAPGAKK